MKHAVQPPQPFIEQVENGSVTSPSGFKAGAVACGIKKSGKPDLALIASDAPCAFAGVLTTNRVHAACIDINRERLSGGVCQAIIVNSGNANCFTGAAGLQDANEVCALAADALGIRSEFVAGASTGHIGERLPMDKLRAGVAQLPGVLSAEGGPRAAQAIMTTDLVPKQAAVRVSLESGQVTIGAVAKGSGMIAPNMATMFCFLTTDADVPAGTLQSLLERAVDESFHCLTVDGDTSTNDMVLMLANGAGGVAVGEGDESRFQAALTLVCQQMAKAIAADGEGATKLIEIRVSGAASNDDARRVGKTIANSPLFKTAMFGCDPNWGRITAAAGRAGVPLDQAKLNLAILEHQIVRDGEPVMLSLDDAASLLKTDFVTIEFDLGLGTGEAVVWTCDLSYDYVRINADYHT